MHGVMQPPLPSHTCVLEHSLSGSAPVGTSLQLPTEPDTSHAMHKPLHALLQHTPSLQMLLAHWPLLLHVLPLPPGKTQLPPLQM
jgi:hypothetical protein